jgi:hypothetical protein
VVGAVEVDQLEDDLLSVVVLRSNECHRSTWSRGSLAGSNRQGIGDLDLARGVKVEGTCWHLVLLASSATSVDGTRRARWWSAF